MSDSGGQKKKKKRNERNIYNEENEKKYDFFLMVKYVVSNESCDHRFLDSIRPVIAGRLGKRGG